MLNELYIINGVKMMLSGLMPDYIWTKDENFKETPARVAKAMIELCHGLYDETNNIKTFPTEYSGIVCVKHIQAVGLCPHHLMPIEYDISFAYIPDGKALGLSKIPRIIKSLAARPVLQEDLTTDITAEFNESLSPVGCAVVVTGKHGCMKFRGIKEQDSVVTSEMSGAFAENEKTRNEFYKILEN